MVWVVGALEIFFELIRKPSIISGTIIISFNDLDFNGLCQKQQYSFSPRNVYDIIPGKCCTIIMYSSAGLIWNLRLGLICFGRLLLSISIYRSD